MPLAGPSMARPEVVAKASSWESIRRITDKLLPRWIRTILDSFEKTRAGTSLRALIRLLEGDESDAVPNEIDWIPIDGPQVEGMRAALPVLMRDVLESSAQEAASMLNRRAELRVVGAFDITNPRVVEWIRGRAASRITEISETSREAIRLLIERGVREGIPPAALGRLIRSSIGLHSRQVRAVMNLRARMVKDGKPAAMIERAVERYTARLIRRRAEMIARTEIIDAEVQGQVALWGQQVEAGVIDAATTGVEIIVTPDDRSCDRCMEHEGEIVPLSSAISGGAELPTFHPQCRCSIRLVFGWAQELGVAA